MIRAAIPLVLLLALLPRPARAETRFVVQARGAGFSDLSPAAPVGGNMATTLGQQRRAAVQYAADLWGARLDSKVPVTLDVTFQKMGCEENGAVLAAAGAISLFSGISSNGADPRLYYPSALANRLAERDLAADEPEIGVIVNTSIDDDCRSTMGGFYYGFDGKAGTRIDLVQVILHELAHGLGFSSWVDLDTGDAIEGGMDVFTAHILDTASSRTWRELSNEERRASARNVRGLAFQGRHTMKAAGELLARGAPTLTLDRPVAGFLGAVADTGHSYPDTEGPVRLAGVFTGCANTPSALDGALVLIRPDCKLSELEPRLMAQGALGVLLALPSSYEHPAIAPSSGARMLGLPSLMISPGDAERLNAALSAGPVTARLRWDDASLLGADSEGRPLLFASRPADDGSSVSHFEPLARPDLMMEPFIGSNATHGFDLTWPVMMDLGWAPFCGDRNVDDGEQCDDGDANSDTTPNACRVLCTRARCGDGVVDKGETCDKGKANSDSQPDACRSSCNAARCGDGVVDMNEQCDQGANNDDARPDACRRDCQSPRCGDGVIDRSEECDGSDQCTSACRLEEVVARGMPPSVDNGRESTWVDPWDAPRADDAPAQKRSSGGCALGGAMVRATGGASLRLLLLLLIVGCGLRRARARAAS